MNFPINTAFAPRGCQIISHALDAWMECRPTEHIVADDIKAMYQNVDRTASFTALKSHTPHLLVPPRHQPLNIQ